MFYFQKRSEETEIMDDLEMEGEELARTLAEIKYINDWLGGNKVVLNALKQIFKNIDPEKTIKILDLGCGGGEILREIAAYCRKKNIKVELVGIDANAFTINYAIEQCAYYKEVSFLKLDIFSDDFKNLTYDIAVCSLFLHHFENDKIVQILRTINKSAKIGLIINDLQRSKIAFFLFNLVTAILFAGKMAKNDGKISIKRSFLKTDLIAYLKASDFNNFKIKWKWAFRYQVIALH